MHDKPPILVLPGESAPEWWMAMRRSLAGEYLLRRYEDRERYISRLADDLASLVLVDGDRDDWVYWTVTPKSSPATRRIPVFVISETEAVRAQAVSAGADLTLTPAQLTGEARRLLKEFARVIDPAQAKQLEQECQQTLPELAQRAVVMFNAGEYYKQHDLFEELWMATDSPERNLYRAILQVGIAYYQIQRGNHRGARKMLLRSVQWLAILPDVCQGVDVKALRQDSARVRAELEHLPEADIERFDRGLLQPVKMVDLNSK